MLFSTLGQNPRLDTDSRFHDRRHGNRRHGTTTSGDAESSSAGDYRGNRIVDSFWPPSRTSADRRRQRDSRGDRQREGRRSAAATDRREDCHQLIALIGSCATDLCRTAMKVYRVIGLRTVGRLKLLRKYGEDHTRPMRAFDQPANQINLLKDELFLRNVTIS